MTTSDHQPVMFDGGGLLCVALLLRLRDVIAMLPAGTVVHVIAADPAGPPPQRSRGNRPETQPPDPRRNKAQ